MRAQKARSAVPWTGSATTGRTPSSSAITPNRMASSPSVRRPVHWRRIAKSTPTASAAMLVAAEVKEAAPASG